MVKAAWELFERHQPILETDLQRVHAWKAYLSADADLQMAKTDIQTAKTDIQTVKAKVQTAEIDLQTAKTVLDEFTKARSKALARVVGFFPSQEPSEFLKKYIQDSVAQMLIRAVENAVAIQGAGA